MSIKRFLKTSDGSTRQPQQRQLPADATLGQAEAVLRRHFGHSSLRPFQREAFLAWASGQDVLVILATGAGKSLCFQLPPLCEPHGRWALVISPLVALMQDQVRTLRQRQISAGLCGSGAQADIGASLQGMAAGAFRIVYMTPEFALTHMKEIAGLRSSICLLGVDEAHCISSWGHDFRPTYREIGRLREVLVGVPVMCVTATCTAEVGADIRRCMCFGSNCVDIKGPMNRANLKYVVRERTSVDADLGDLFGIRQQAAKGGRCQVGATTANASEEAQRVEGRRMAPVDNSSIGPTSSAIVYVNSKARCEEIASWLAGRGVLAAAYHAGLAMGTRRKVHSDFIMDDVQVVVATIAFGMGIDKPSIRRIVHYGAVRSLEHYVQQCGRAGRDGEDSECITFMRASQDSQEARSLILADYRQDADGSKAHCERMLALHSEAMSYLTDGNQCRRVRLLSHFGENPIQWQDVRPPPRGECVAVAAMGGRARCNWCDICESGPAMQARGDSSDDSSADFTRECRILLQCVEALRGRTGAAVPCALAAGNNLSAMRQKHMESHPLCGSGSHRSLKWWRAFLPHVLRKGILQEQPATLSIGRSYVAVSVSDSGKAFSRSSDMTFILSPIPKELQEPVAKPPTMPSRCRAAASAASAAPATSAENDAGQSVDAPSTLTVRSSAVPTGTPEELYRRLLHTRLRWQRKMGVVGESLVSNVALRSFAIVRPSTVEYARRHVDNLPSALSEDPLVELINETRHFCMEHGLLLDAVAVSSEAGAAHPGKRELDHQDDDLPLAKVFRPMRSIATTVSCVEQEQELPQEALQQQQLQLMQMQQQPSPQLASHAASTRTLDAFDALSFQAQSQGQAKVASGLETSASARHEATTRQDLNLSGSGWLSTPRKQLQPAHREAFSTALIASDGIATPQRQATVLARTQSCQAQQTFAAPPCTELKLTVASPDIVHDDASVLGLLDGEFGPQSPVKPSDAPDDHVAHKESTYDDASVLHLLDAGLPKLQPSEVLHFQDAGPALQTSDVLEASLVRSSSGDDWLDVLEM